MEGDWSYRPMPIIQVHSHLALCILDAEAESWIHLELYYLNIVFPNKIPCKTEWHRREEAPKQEKWINDSFIFCFDGSIIELI
jgi:hypothetical protein